MHYTQTAIHTLYNTSSSGRADYIPPASVLFSHEDTVGTVKLVQLTIQDDQRVEDTETLNLVIVNDSSTMNPVTSGSRGVVVVSLQDNDGKPLQFLTVLPFITNF